MQLENETSSTREAGVSIKPGVQRSETPGSSTQKFVEFAKRPMALRIEKLSRGDSTVGRSAGFNNGKNDGSWGYAALHPRLYADTRFAG
jgi:hypothetical protein